MRSTRAIGSWSTRKRSRAAEAVLGRPKPVTAAGEAAEAAMALAVALDATQTSWEMAARSFGVSKTRVRRFLDPCDVDAHPNALHMTRCRRRAPRLLDAYVRALAGEGSAADSLVRGALVAAGKCGIAAGLVADALGDGACSVDAAIAIIPVAASASAAWLAVQRCAEQIARGAR
jgi:hypothetical protein